MGFLAPWFLAGLAAIGVPVYIHLLRRHTTTPRPVSSLMFFERGTQSSVRHRRLRYLLLFALRALLLLLLILAFANPFIRRSSAAASDHLLVIAVDDTFSMHAGTRLADAKRQAAQILSTRRPSQRAQIMVLSGKLQVLTQPVQDSSQLSAALDGIQPSDAHGSFGELGRGMRAMAETVHTPIDLHLFSDMQASNMPANFADMVMPGNVALTLHPVAQSALPNWTVESVKAPGELVDPKKTRVLAVIAGHGTPQAARTVSLLINGKASATKKLEVPADGRATIVFDSLDVPYGTSRCEVRIDASDAFPADDGTVFAVKRADPEKVLFVHQSSDRRSPLYFGAALAAAAQASFVLQPINVEQSTDADPTKYAFVVLSDVTSLPSLLENNLNRFVENGGSVLIAAGIANAHHQRLPVFAESVADGHFYSRSGGFATVGQTDPAHPVMQASAAWPDAKFFYASSIDLPKDPKQIRVLAKLSDGTPLVLDKQMGQGHVLLFASGFDNVSNDLPLQPSFVPFVDLASRYLSGMEQASGARLVDSFVQLRNPTNDAAAKSQGSPVEITGPDGKRPLSLREEATAQSFQVASAGFYQVRFANGRDGLIAVNPDRRESDLALIPHDTLQLWSGPADPATAAANATAIPNTVPPEERRSITSLWWWVMLVALIAALAESVLASRYLGTQREEA